MRPKYPRQDDTWLRFLGPRPEPAVGLSTVSADLGAHFVVVARVGRDEALLLLLVRALRQRSGLLGVRLHDLAWVLGVSHRRILRWLDRLVRHRLLVYHLEDRFGIGLVAVELSADAVASTTFARAVHHDVPTVWFVQVLPLVGRATFTVFLFFLSCEPEPHAPHIDHLVAAVRLKGRAHARLLLRRLRRHGLVADHPSGAGILLKDPTPPTRATRLLLTFLALPFLRGACVQVARLLLLVLVGLLALLATALVPSPPHP